MPYLRNIYYTMTAIPRRLKSMLGRADAGGQQPDGYGWAIDERAAQPPEGWAGWPEGKKFALVLTHDVLSAQGYARCRKLAQLEDRLGFRACFNFFPEKYPVAEKLWVSLGISGCEVGMYGMRHDTDGLRPDALAADPRSQQLKEAGTIFPFLIGDGTQGGGCIKLPRTLPSDHSLFVERREKGIEAWKRRLDWIAAHGGMALLDVHPDYMRFSGDGSSDKEYPAAFYEEFLEYIRSTYPGQYWNCLPRDIARFWSAGYAGKEKRHRPKIHACMLSYSFYDIDNRVMRYAEALAKRGDDVDVIALREKGQPDFDVVRGVNVYRIQERVRDESGKLDYLYRICKFVVKSTSFLTRKHWKNPYQLIHVHSVPDFEVFATVLAKLKGAKIILDIHDIVPELYVSKFGSRESGLLFKSLVGVERLSTGYADHVIIANHIWEKRLIERSVEPGKCSVFLNYPDHSLFYPQPRARTDDKIIMLYPGTLNWHQGLDIAVKALALVKDQLPRAELHIYGNGKARHDLEKLSESLGLNGRVVIRDMVPIDKVAEIMANADLGIVPKRNSAFGGEAFSTKILEFLTVGVPVIVSDTKIDKLYFNDDVVRFFRSDDEEDLASAIRDMAVNKDLRERMVEKAAKHAEKFSWDRRKHEYFDLVDRLTGQ
jgi:glycosyltransferase involved in cell wall biosynthesis